MRYTERHALLTLSFWQYSLLTQLDSITVAEIQGTRVLRLILVEYVLCILALYSSSAGMRNSTVCIELGRWKARRVAVASRVLRTY